MFRIAIALFSLSFLALAQDAADPIEEMRFKFEVAEAKLTKPLLELEVEYEKDLEALRKVVLQTGILDNVLAVQKEKEKFRDGGGGGDRLTALVELRTAYREKRSTVEAQIKGSRVKLIADYRKELLAYGRKANDDGKAEVVESVKTELSTLSAKLAGGVAKEAAVAATPPAESGFTKWAGTGRFYCMADDRASIYINGELAHRGHLGRSTAAESCALKVGDRITISLTNYDGGKQFKAAFASDDGEVVMSLRAADFVEVGNALGKRRSFTMEEMAAGDADAVKARRKAWGADQPLKIPNQSEWIWGGSGNRSLLLGVIKPSMFSRMDDPNNAPAFVKL